ncbi:MAG: hypothetical protein LBV69_01210 [Bacteroidales bacterium]|nr:hypothetical protein [Bacteroidales bacterium]
MNVAYFEQVYENIYLKFSELYPSKTISGLKLQRVDSSLVSEASSKLRVRMSCSNEHKKKNTLLKPMHFPKI